MYIYTWICPLFSLQIRNILYFSVTYESEVRLRFFGYEYYLFYNNSKFHIEMLTYATCVIKIIVWRDFKWFLHFKKLLRDLEIQVKFKYTTSNDKFLREYFTKDVCGCLFRIEFHFVFCFYFFDFFKNILDSIKKRRTKGITDLLMVFL